MFDVSPERGFLLMYKFGDWGSFSVSYILIRIIEGKSMVKANKKGLILQENYE
jgi:hypothetical protein